MSKTYRRPVAFGEHRMMLHPRNSHDQKVIQADLKISPEPTSLRFVSRRIRQLCGDRAVFTSIKGAELREYRVPRAFAL